MLRRVPSISTWPEIEDVVDATFQAALHDEGFDLDRAISDVEAASADAFRRSRTADEP